MKALHEVGALATILFLLGNLASAIAQQETSSTGKEGCPCMDSSLLLDSLSDCMIEGEGLPTRGVKVGETCYPSSYGSKSCVAHDLATDPLCQEEANAPAYCFNPWCYVNATKCHTSEETYFRSRIFNSFEMDTVEELYYSYSTCDSSVEDWYIFTTTEPLARRPLTAVIPKITFEDHYKLDSSGEVVEAGGEEAYNNNIPWQGWIIDYFNMIAGPGRANLPGVNYIHRSRSSRAKGTNSSYTQAVTDVGAGVADAGVGAFWITAERLNITTFTVPVAGDKIYLWIPQPELDGGTLEQNVQKLLRPFSGGLWALLGGAIVSFAFMSALVSPKRFQKRLKSNNKDLSSIKQFYKLMGEALTVSFLEFFGGGVDYMSLSNFPQKILNLGFALIVFVSVAAYTANLAAFLTISNAKSYISDMNEASRLNAPICTPGVLERDLLSLYPEANLIIFKNQAEAMKGYDEGKCSAVLRGYIDVPGSKGLQDFFCSRGLVRSEVPAMEVPIGFPARKELVGGLSYWISQAKNDGEPLESFMSQDLECSLEIVVENVGADELIQLTPTNMFLPFMVYGCCIAFAVACHVAGAWKKRRQNPDDDDGVHGKDTVYPTEHADQSLPPREESAKVEASLQFAGGDPAAMISQLEQNTERLIAFQRNLIHNMKLANVKNQISEIVDA